MNADDYYKRIKNLRECLAKEGVDPRDEGSAQLRADREKWLQSVMEEVARNGGDGFVATTRVKS